MIARETEYLLIGSGVAAVTLAEQLLAANPGTDITILEAGAIYSSRDRRAWWDYVITGKANYNPAVDEKTEYSVKSNVNWDCHDNRLIAYGGSTLHWGGWSLRFKPEDFRLHANTGLGVDWPFAYDTLHRYYYAAEKRLAVCGNDNESWNHVRRVTYKNEAGTEVERVAQPYPMPPFEWTGADGEMIGAFTQLGIEPGRMPLARFRKCMATGTCKYCPLGARYTAQDALDDLRGKQVNGQSRHPRLHVHERVAVTRLLMNGKRQVTGVEYIDYSEDPPKPGKLLATRVIVCAGAYETPKLLLRSVTPEWPKGVGNDHENVGCYLVSHSIVRVRGVKQGNPECWLQEYDFPTLMSRTYDTPEYQRFGKLFLFKNRKLPNLDLAREMSAGRSREEIERKLRTVRTMELQGFIEEKGKQTNCVRPGDKKTRWGLPTTDVVFDRTPDEMANCESRVELLQRVIRAMGYQVIIAQVDKPGGHHATGTCRMSSHPEAGVTTPDLLVHGTDNLYVCSNAVFPTGSAVNPTLTLVALALRLGDHLLGRPALNGDQP